MRIFKTDRDPDKSEWSPVLGVSPRYILDFENFGRNAFVSISCAMTHV